MMVDHGEPLLFAALEGLGIMLQPTEMVRDALADGRLVRLLPEWEHPGRPMHLLYAPDRRPTPKLRSFIDFALAEFGQAEFGAPARLITHPSAFADRPISR